MTICFEGKRFELLPDETVLEGIERQGCNLPAFCRRGICQTCLVKATQGSVPPAALPEGFHAVLLPLKGTVMFVHP